MSTATASDLTLPTLGGHRQFLLRRLHSLTGILFGGYIVVHLLVNASLIQSTKPSDVFQIQVDKIHSLPFLILIEWLFIYLPIIYHTVYGLWITFSGQPNLGRYPYSKNYFYFFQRLSAILIVIFLAFHVLGMKGLFGSNLEFDPLHATATTVRHIRSSAIVTYVLYPLGVLASAYHLANGFWTAAISWGLTISATAQKRWGYVCFGLFLLTFACGMTALFAIITHGKI